MNTHVSMAAAITLMLIHSSACSDDGAAMSGQVMPPAFDVSSASGTGAPITPADGMESATATAAPVPEASGAGAPTATAPSVGTPMLGTDPMTGTGGDPMLGTDPMTGTGSDPMPGADPMTGAADDMGEAEAPAAAVGKLPHVETTDGPGPFDGAVKDKNTPPGGWLIYPEEIGKDGIKHPLFMFGPGGGTTPQTYEDSMMHWVRYSSYGFVIYVPPRSSFGGADAFEQGLTWLIAQNDDSSSPLYQHLDTTKVAVGGHSLGSEMTFNFMPDDRVTTTIHISGGSLGGSGVKNLSNPTMFMCGPSADIAFAQCENDFELTEVPTFYTTLNDSSHTTTARDGWAATIAWMLWQLAGHEEWKAKFLEPDGEFQTGIYSSQTKNW